MKSSGRRGDVKLYFSGFGRDVQVVPLILECFGLMDSVGSRWLRSMFRNDLEPMDSLDAKLALICGVRMQV